MTNYTPMPTRRPSEPKTYPVCSLKKALDIIKSKCGDVYVKERHGKGRNKVTFLAMCIPPHVTPYRRYPILK